MVVNRAINYFFNALYPRFCARCGEEGDWLCVNCRGTSVASVVSEKCPFCEIITTTGATCRECSRVRALDGCVSFGTYKEPIIRGMLGLWKYYNVKEAENYIASWIKRTPVNESFASLPWVVVPVSLHGARRRERGFDQSEAIAKMVSLQINRPVAKIIARTRKTKSQARTKSDLRAVGSLYGSFEVRGVAPPYVLLCDDVITSGATLEAAARALKDAGAEVVWAMTLLRG